MEDVYGMATALLIAVSSSICREIFLKRERVHQMIHRMPLESGVAQLYLNPY